MVHRNGTAGADLLEQVCEASRALDVALRVMADASPNARDYYVIGEDAYGQAALEHRRRCEAVRAIRDQYADLAERIAAQPPI